MNQAGLFAIGMRILGPGDGSVLDCVAPGVFDQGLGDLFVIRVAGNIVAPSQIGLQS